ncbi:MAG: hypothetical protein ACI4TB_05030 [Lachnospiraceae bacterium]
MGEMKFKAGTPVFFYTIIDKIPGVIQDAVKSESGEWLYEIFIGDTMIAKNVREDRITVRTLIDPPKFKRGDSVRFPCRGQILVGTIEIVDAYGTFEQDEEPSYDILVGGTEKDCLYKHIRESEILGIAE